MNYSILPHGRSEGLYGELVKNRSFEFPDRLMGWEAFGTFEVKDDGPFERCPHYVELRYPGHDERRSGLSNNGFFGIIKVDCSW